MKNTLIKSTYIFFLLLFSSQVFALNTVQEKKWSEDIDYYYDSLKKNHINLFHTVSEKEFTAELDLLRSRLPNLDESQVILEMMRITRLVGDAHTHISLMSKSHRHYPLRYRLYNGDVRVMRSSKGLRTHLGSKLIAIDDKPITDILKIISPITQSVENDHSLRESMAFSLTLDEMLYTAGITNSLGRARLSFEDDAGKLKTVSVTPVSMGKFIKKTTYDLNSDIYFSEKTIVHSEGLWLSHDPESKTAYLNFSRYASFEETAQFSGAVRNFLEKHKAKNLIVDLRDNEGGDFMIGIVLISELLETNSLDWNNGIYTLIGGKTFSAGMSNATHLRQIMNARLVGEPTGTNPNGPQEISYSVLPNSKYHVGYSTRFYRFQDTNSQGVQPDVFIEAGWEDYKDGKDQALRWIMNDIKSRSHQETSQQDKASPAQ